MRSAKKSIGAAVLAGLFASACSSAGANFMKTAAAESRQALAAGDFQRAIDAYKVPFKRDPHRKGLAAAYARAVGEIYLAAEHARGRQDFVLAARIYRVLLDNSPDFKNLAGGVSFSKGDLEAGLRDCRIALVDAQARQEMKAGNLAKALGSYTPLFKEYPRDSGLSSRYLRIVQDIEALGDKARADGNFAQAGLIFALLLENFPALEERQATPPLTKAELAAGLALCREGLTKTGLREYRNGNLAKAIAVWESLLVFDPDNAEIKKAVETAKTQLNEILKKK
jgi:tetratricopeptide (TPR) repeat protein